MYIWIPHEKLIQPLFLFEVVVKCPNLECDRLVGLRYEALAHEVRQCLNQRKALIVQQHQELTQAKPSSTPDQLSQPLDGLLSQHEEERDSKHIRLIVHAIARKCGPC